MYEHITVTDNSSQPHVIFISQIVQYYEVGGTGTHTQIVLSPGGFQNVAETMSAVAALIDAAINPPPPEEPEA